MAFESQISPPSFQYKVLAPPRPKDAAAPAQPPQAHPPKSGRNGFFYFSSASASQDASSIPERSPVRRCDPALPAKGSSAAPFSASATCRERLVDVRLQPAAGGRSENPRPVASPPLPQRMPRLSQGFDRQDRGVALEMAARVILGEEPVRPLIPRTGFDFASSTVRFARRSEAADADAQREERGGRRRKQMQFEGCEEEFLSLDHVKAATQAAAPSSSRLPDAFAEAKAARRPLGQSEGNHASRRAPCKKEPVLPRGKVHVPPVAADEVALFTKLQETEVVTKDDSKSMATRMRCRNVLLCYALLDPYNQGYIDVQEACDIIGNIHKQDKEVAELLLAQLQEVLAFVSARGVIEKQDFLTQVLRRVESDIAGLTPFHCLRNSSNPIAAAWQRGRPFTTVLNRSFYQGDYVPAGVKQHAHQAEAFGMQFSLQRRGGGRVAVQTAEPVVSQARPRARGTLADHIRRGKLRRLKKEQQIKEDLVHKELSECTFHPKTTPLRPASEPFPSREKVRRMVEEQDNAARRRGLFIEHDVADASEHVLALPPELSEEDKKAIQKQHEKDHGLVSNEGAGNFVTWVMHKGDPGMNPLEWRDTLKEKQLPEVPLDNDDDFGWSTCDIRRLLEADVKPEPIALKAPLGLERGKPDLRHSQPRLRGPVPFGDIFIQAPYVAERQCSKFDRLVPDAPEPLDDGMSRIGMYESENRLRIDALPAYYRQPLRTLVECKDSQDGGRLPTKKEKAARLQQYLRILEETC
ncbi:hypothetical protein BESB_010930 [Besnoitia besnoiti]|uniref:EF-hand domain-containing protein n=1 Tax=Besnoitia besnoiti TaxID=94643 RepID=A0A2A9MPT5_BESBE|nr:hypothetical protein BESB_010930 [Besnoitia besnoiti]PFH38751.1 hypothetical protein BESB_010930 [Besnoitia besnoiti]